MEFPALERPGWVCGSITWEPGEAGGQGCSVLGLAGSSRALSPSGQLGETRHWSWEALELGGMAFAMAWEGVCGVLG